MTTLFRTRMDWTGFSGAPGVSTLYSVIDSGLVVPLRALMASMAPHFTTNISTLVESSGDSIESTTGALVGAWSEAPVLPVVGTDTGKYAAPVGFCVNWNTTTILDGSRIGGRTFFVPAAAANFDTNGTLQDTSRAEVVASVQTFFNAVVGNLAVWHRPYAGRVASPGVPARAAHPGGHGLVTGFSVPDKAIVLRSRRD